jgi:predicted porin
VNRAKSLVALATLAAATGAFAQTPNARALTGSNVEIFGVADASVRRLSATGNGSLTIMDGTGTNESTRLGFRGLEDMGGGWGAGFWLEAAYDQDRGTGSNTTSTNTRSGDAMIFNSSTPTTAATATAAGAGPTTPATQSLGGRQGLTFNRAATVSLIGKDVGEIRLGRDYTATFWSMTGFDPFGTVGSGSALNVIAGPLAPYAAVNSPPGGAVPTVRTSNAISWLSNDMNGLRAQVQYAFAESPTTCDASVGVQGSVQGTYCPGFSGDGKLVALRLRYESGPVNVAYANSKVTYNKDSLAQTQPGITIPSGGAPATSQFGAASQYAGDMTTNNLAGSYTMGATRLMAQIGSIERAANAATVNQKLNYKLVGVSHTMGAWTLKASSSSSTRADGAVLSTSATLYNTDKNGKGYEDGAKAKQNAVGFVYDLSKRTAIYGTYSKLTINTGAATSVGTSTGSTSIRASMGLNSQYLGANSSANTTGIDIGFRTRF